VGVIIVTSRANEKDLGAEYAVFPPHALGMLRSDWVELQQELDRMHRPIFVDGAIGAIYDLR
jgi:hypothetical protein